jgi:hypothetical protein
MTKRTLSGPFAAFAILLASTGCSTAPTAVAGAGPESGFHAKSWVDATMTDSLSDRGDVIVTNEPRGWYR